MSELIKSLGGPVAVARILGIKPPSVIGWRGIPPADRCPALERALNARFTVEQMRPDVLWCRVPDPGWPHPDGRPCIDVAGNCAEPASALTS